MSVDVTAPGPLAAEVAASRGKATPAIDSTAIGDWTVMVYITATDLAENAPGNIVQMETIAARLGPSVKIVVLYDQWLGEPFPTGAGSQAPWTTVGFATIEGDPHSGATADSEPLITTRFDVRPEADTGDPATLSSFIVEAAQVAPASHYALILWDHGSGVFGSNFDYNDTLPDDHLVPGELAQALGDARASGVAIDLLAFDACLMATAEVSYAVRDLTTVFVASQEVIPGHGYNYETALAVLAERPPGSVTAEDLAASLVKSYQDAARKTEARQDTLSAIRTDRLDALTLALADFVAATEGTRASDWPLIRDAAADATEFSATNFRDLGQFLSDLLSRPRLSAPLRDAAQAALAALEAAVFIETESHFDVSGLSIYLPRGTQRNEEYDTLAQPFLADTGWSDFLRRLLRTGPLPNSTGDWAGRNQTPDRALALGNAVGVGLRLPHLSLAPGQSDWFRVGITDTTPRSLIRLAGPARAALRLYSPEDLTRPVARGGRVLSLRNLPSDDYLLQVVPQSQRARDLGLYSLIFHTPSRSGVPVDRPSGNDTPDVRARLGTITSAGLVFALGRATPRRPAWFGFELPRANTPQGRFSGGVVVLSAGQPLTARLYRYDNDNVGERTLLSATTGRRNLILPYRNLPGDSQLLIEVTGAVGSYNIFFTDPSLRRQARIRW